MIKPTPLRPVGIIDHVIEDLTALLEETTDMATKDRIGEAVINLMSAAASVRWATELLLRGSTCPVVDADD